VSEKAAEERIDFVVKNLIAYRATHGVLPETMVQQAAVNLGVDRRTIWRWVTNGGATRSKREQWQPMDEDLLLYFECGGNVRAVWERRRQAGQSKPSERQLRRAFEEALTPAERAYAKDGIAGYRRYSLHLRVEQEHRNELWQADHCQLPIWVGVPRRTDWFQPWVTLFLDCRTRAIAGYAISLQPTAAEVLAAVRSAITVDSERGPFGGVPEMILWDNGREFLSDDVTSALQDLGTYVTAAKPYSPHEKGKVERFFGTLAQELLRTLPYFIDGPRKADGKLHGPSSGPLSLEEFVAHFDGYIQHYNNERIHSSVGMTPRAAWEADPQPLRVINEADLRWMLLGSALRKIRKDGVLWAGKPYFATALHGLIGEEVEVRHMPHDGRRIWIYRNGQFLCEAVPHEDVPEETRRAHLGTRTSALARARSLRQTTSRRQRATRHERRGRIEPMTEPGEVVDTIAPVIDKPKAKPTRMSAETLDILGIANLNEPVEDEV
jgi:putative transposase